VICNVKGGPAKTTAVVNLALQFLEGALEFKGGKIHFENRLMALSIIMLGFLIKMYAGRFRRDKKSENITRNVSPFTYSRPGRASTTK